MGDKYKSLLDLPPDILSDILTRVPYETVARSRVVCMEWNKFSYSSAFKELQLQRTMILSGFITGNKPIFGSINKSTNRSPLNFLSADNNNVKVEASTECGLLLCRKDILNSEIPSFFICKLSTEQWIQLPNPWTMAGYFTITMAMRLLHTNPLQFQIVRLSKSHDDYQGRQLSKVNIFVCETFDSRTWQWKQLKNVTLWWLEDLKNETAISVGSAHHWLLSTMQVLAFLPNKESWIKFPTPDRRGMYHFMSHLAKYEGKLAFFSVYEGMIHLWEMKDRKSRIWIHKLTINMEAPWRLDRYCYPRMFYGSDVVVLSGLGTLLYYNFRTRKCDVMELGDHFDNSYFFSICSDFDPCNFEKINATRERIRNRRLLAEVLAGILFLIVAPPLTLALTVGPPLITGVIFSVIVDRWL